MSNTRTIARRSAFGLATMAIAATAITLPLVATPAPAQAAFGGCLAEPTTLEISKVDPSGNPLEGAVFEVSAQHWERNFSHGDRFAENPLAGDYAAAEEHADALRDAADAARTAAQAADAAAAEAQAVLDEALAEADEALADLYATLTAATQAYSDARSATASARENLTAAEWNGDAEDIAAAQSALDEAEAAEEQALADLQAAQAALDAAGETSDAAQAVVEARAALIEALAEADAAHAAYEEANAESATANRATEAIMIDALEVVSTEVVSTDEDGRAVLEVLEFGECVSGTPSEPVRDTAEVVAPVITETAAPAGYELDQTPHTAQRVGGEGPGEGSWSVEVVNHPTPPTPPTTPPATPPSPPLAQTGSDLAKPAAFGAMLAAAGGVLASGPLLRRLTRRS